MVCDAYPKIQIGQYAPDFIGWQPIHSTGEHEHAPSPVISYTKRGLEARFATLLIPSEKESDIQASVTLTDNGFVIGANGESFAFDHSDPRFATVRNRE